VTLHFTSLTPGATSLTLSSVTLRDTANVPIASTNTGGSVTVLTPLVGVTAFLEGTYLSATTSMRNSLKTGGVLATTFPSAFIPGNAVDSVNIEIRNNVSAAASTVRRFAPAWILTNGTLRGFSDTTQSGVAFDAPAGSYYIVVRHRNHLAIMSSVTVSLTNTPVNYDFTMAMTAAYGTDPMKALAGSRYGMFAGDVNANGQLKYNLAGNDRAMILTRVGGTNINATVAGYYNEDVSMDGVVKYNLAGNDRAIILQNIGGTNINATNSTQVPN
jgi:hypothetical protein